MKKSASYERRENELADMFSFEGKDIIESKKDLIGFKAVHNLLLEVVIPHQKRVLLVQKIYELTLKRVHRVVLLLGLSIVKKILLQHLILHLEAGGVFVAVFAAVEHLGDLVELVHDSEVFGMFFVFFDQCWPFEGFDKGAQDADAVEKVRLEIETVLFSQPELIVIVVQTLLRHADCFGSFLQAHLLEAASTLMQISPLFYYLYHLEDHSLLAPFLLQRYNFTQLLAFQRGLAREAGCALYDGSKLNQNQIAAFCGHPGRGDFQVALHNAVAVLAEIVDSNDFSLEVDVSVFEGLAEEE